MGDLTRALLTRALELKKRIVELRKVGNPNHDDKGRFSSADEAHQVHRQLKSGGLSKEPSTPYGKLTHLMSKDEAEAHAKNMMSMNPGSTYVVKPSGQPLPDLKALRADAARARQAGRIGRYLAQKPVGHL